MPAKKMRVEIVDTEGNKYSMTLEGKITRNKALNLIDMIELMCGISSGDDNKFNNDFYIGNYSKFDKIKLLIQKKFPLVWFTSLEVQREFEREFKEPIGLSTVSTYLSRLSVQKMLQRGGSSNKLKYKLWEPPSFIYAAKK